MPPNIFTGVVLMLASALPAAGAETLRNVPVTNQFKVYEHEWPSNLGGMIVYWNNVVLDGTQWICGAAVTIDARAQLANRNLLRKGFIKETSSNRKALSNLSYFAFHKNNQAAKSGTATCKSTGQPSAGQQYRIGFHPFNTADPSMDSF